MKEAKVVFTNGLKFEGWINRLVRSSGTRAKVVEAARGARTIKVDEAAPGHDHGDHSHAGEVDPHAWQSVANAKVYVQNIREGLVAADPAGREAYEANAAAYLARLDELEREVKEIVGRIPPERRRVITSHDAFGYFAEAYGVAFIAPQGVSTEAEASARDVARIIGQIGRRRSGAVFWRTSRTPALPSASPTRPGPRSAERYSPDRLSDASGPPRPMSTWSATTPARSRRRWRRAPDPRPRRCRARSAAADSDMGPDTISTAVARGRRAVRRSGHHPRRESVASTRAPARPPRARAPVPAATSSTRSPARTAGERQGLLGVLPRERLRQSLVILTTASQISVRWRTVAPWSRRSPPAPAAVSGRRSTAENGAGCTAAT
jgi:hypothetical protein